MANYLRAIVTDVEGSAIQAHAAKLLLASVKQIENEAGNLHCFFLNFHGTYGVALGEVRMHWILNKEPAHLAGDPLAPVDLLAYCLVHAIAEGDEYERHRVDYVRHIILILKHIGAVGE